MKRIYMNDIEGMYIDMLDDVEDEVNICGYKYTPSSTLLGVDPIVYHEGFRDYIDGLLTDEIIFEHSDGNYYDESPGIDDND